ncbi:hypothetical protein GOARA_026_00570 [Gordonia araii NBRC 100433]|uniref:Uncharacterized protein n=1 Tax=Gordonia araii NBRC 100433 TaxID=1073574 RepID=G7GZK2_9ACTN|nr:helix-turn-helix domain-containing protein [Gordonia araii]NNG97904.1 helix-turn-helix domain-containing protein [Gordonia araii NBRC 100433]GAB09027.1 hypothetical protein GOARA_026_00570 [Gordonia araii NBRC 100433]
MNREDFLTIEETAHNLGVSTRHARRLADSGAINRVARGLVDRASVDRYLQSQRQGRTRSWAEHTAWGAAAILAGREADWLGATQVSRLRQALRSINEVDELLTRMRDRALSHTFDAHRAALPRLRELVTTSSTEPLGITGTLGDVDGYIAAGQLNDIVRALGLRPSSSGAVTLRVTDFDFTRVRNLVETPVVAALDIATSTDPRLRGVGHRALGELLEAYREHRPSHH